MANIKRRKKRRKKMTTKERVISAIVITLGVVVVGAMGLKLLMNWKPLDRLDTYSNESLITNTTTANGDSEPEEVVQAAEYTNILCLGFDEDGIRTDVMMLVSLNKETNEMNILQIPRDTYIYNLGTTEKINSAYTTGGSTSGIQNIVTVINKQFQLPVHYYVAIGCDDIVEIVDKVGGVPIDIPERIIYEGGKIIEPGQQVLSGEKAEWFVRYRKVYAQGDLGRMKTQRIFLAACMAKAKDLGLTEVVSLIPTITENISTDMSIGEMKTMAGVVLNFDIEKCTFYMLPGEGNVTTDKGQSVYSVHSQEVANLLNEKFRPNGQYVDVKDLELYELRNTTDYFDDDSSSIGDIIKGDIPNVPRDYSSAPEY
ncbi:MAG: LCP family protein [Clostridiales bacterium]|nr:LCP family protein [Clostridiales bacterium]